jgi:hypothetical protein
MFPVPESNWMGHFAVSIAVGYQIGTGRGDRSILSAMDIQNNELFATIGRSINDLILHHRKDLETKRGALSNQSEPRGRWVDGTPEYSFHIYGLRKLFPDALFIHICRDVRAVVRSMLNFHRLAGTQLVANEEEAYRYWIRTVRACVAAECAYGPNIVRRTRYADLIENPEPTLHSLLEFLGEPYTAKCLEPLGQRINSSDVPDDFRADDPATDPAVVEEATRLSRELEETAQPEEASQAAADEMEGAFAQRTEYIATLERQYQRALEMLRELEQTKVPPRPVLQTAVRDRATSVKQQ